MRRRLCGRRRHRRGKAEEPALALALLSNLAGRVPAMARQFGSLGNFSEEVSEAAYPNYERTRHMCRQMRSPEARMKALHHHLPAPQAAGGVKRKGRNRRRSKAEMVAARRQDGPTPASPASPASPPPGVAAAPDAAASTRGP